MERSIVSIVKGTDPDKMVEEVLSLLGGVDNLIKPNSTVVIKPNAGHPIPAETSANTSPAFVAAVIKVLRKANPKEIIMAEASAMGCDTMECFEVTGIGKAAKEAGIDRIIDIKREENLIKMVHGGAIYLEQALKDTKSIYDPFFEETRNREAKELIGKKAAGLVEENDTIVLGIGSTTDRVATQIRTDIRLTVICYSLNILNTVCKVKNWETIIPGGYYHSNSRMFENSYGVDVLKKMRATKAFLGASGISHKLGVTCSFVHEVEMRKAVINSSDTKILVADSSKFGDVKIGHFAELSDFNVIVTDAGIPREYIDIVNEMGISLHIAQQVPAI